VSGQGPLGPGRSLVSRRAGLGRSLVELSPLVEELGAVVADVVDGGGDGPGLQVAFGRLAEQGPQLVGILMGGVEPGVVVVGG